MSTTIKIQVYIDLENIQPPQAEERARRRVSLLLSGIRSYLETNGYHVERVWACAKPRAPEKTRVVIDEVFAEFGAVMFWTKKSIADFEIVEELKNRFKAGVLTPAILFISNDSDFSAPLSNLKEAGIEVIVAGTSVGGQLRQSANRVIALSDLV